MSRLKLNGIELYYRVIGSGPPLMLISGLASDHRSWDTVSGELARQFTLVMPDNRGVGRTESGSEAFTITDMARDCSALIRQLEYPNIGVVGHSMGGAIALELAAMDPKSVSSVVVASSCPELPDHARKLVEQWIQTRQSGMEPEDWFLDLFQWLFSPPFFDNPELVQAALDFALNDPYPQSDEAFALQANGILNYKPQFSLASINQPVQVLHGDNDRLFNFSSSMAAFKGMPDVSMKIISNAAHALHVEQPQAFVDAVARFFRQQ